jgi:hypothetical protein
VVALCLLTGGVAVGCADTDDTAGTTDTRSAGQLLNDVNRTMKALTSVTIETDTVSGMGNSRSSTLRTDLKGPFYFNDLQINSRRRPACSA